MKRAVAAFELAESLIQEYRSKVLNVKDILEDHLRARKPLPQDIRDVLLNPASSGYLRSCIGTLDYVEKDLLRDLNIMREHLAQCNVIDALLVAESFSRDVFRSLGGVVGEYPYESNLLPPPYTFFQRINDKTKIVFPRNLDSPLETKEKRDFANYLRNVDNPWVKYATP